MLRLFLQLKSSTWHKVPSSWQSYSILSDGNPSWPTQFWFCFSAHRLEDIVIKQIRCNKFSEDLCRIWFMYPERDADISLAVYDLKCMWRNPVSQNVDINNYLTCFYSKGMCFGLRQALTMMPKAVFKLVSSTKPSASASQMVGAKDHHIQLTGLFSDYEIK